jgi:hypothetical protein
MADKRTWRAQYPEEGRPEAIAGIRLKEDGSFMVAVVPAGDRLHERTALAATLMEAKVRAEAILAEMRGPLASPVIWRELHRDDAG